MGCLVILVIQWTSSPAVSQRITTQVTSFVPLSFEFLINAESACRFPSATDQVALLTCQVFAMITRAAKELDDFQSVIDSDQHATISPR